MEPNPIPIHVSSVADLDRAIASHPSESLRFFVRQLDDLREAEPLLHRLRQICTSRADKEMDPGCAAALLEASKYSKKLEVLELRLGVLRLEILDMEDGVAVRNLRREISDQKQPGSISSHLLDITNEVEEVERIASVLGFTSSLPSNASDQASMDAVKRFFADSLVDWEDSNGKAEVKESMKSLLVEKIQSLTQDLHKMKKGRFSLGGVN